MSGLLEELDISTEGQRKAIDADWTKRKKAAVAVGACLAAVVAAVAGVAVYRANAPVRLPRSADEAATVMASDRFDELPRDRQTQYANEAARLMQNLDESEVRTLFAEDPDAARAMVGRIFEARGREAMIARAYGEEVDFRAMFEGFRNLRGAMTGGRDWESMTDQERRELMQERMAAMQERMQQEMAEQVNTGNPQDAAMRSAMRGRGRGMRGGGGGGRRRP